MAFDPLEFVGDFPQSGERVRGFAGIKAQLEHYPDFEDITPMADQRLIGDDERWAITPGYTVVPLASRNQYTTVWRQRYPDGSWWHTVSLVELRDGMLYRLESFFAPEMDPPEWRRGITEIVSRDSPPSG